MAAKAKSRAGAIPAKARSKESTREQRRGSEYRAAAGKQPARATRGAFTLSCRAEDQQPERIHAYLTRSYWAEGISLDLVRRCVAGSLCFGIFHRGEQIALARVVTDKASFAYLCDVYVLEEFRGQGLAQWLMASVQGHPDLQGLRRFMLATRDAHGLYAKFGFKPTAKPEALMEIVQRGLYLPQKKGR